MTNPLVLRFGIPSLDRLLGISAPFPASVSHASSEKMFGFPLRYPASVDRGDTAPESICAALIGADGTGKSLLALHAAAQWVQDTAADALVFYASTDLSIHRATRSWLDFALGATSRVEEVFSTRGQLVARRRGCDLELVHDRGTGTLGLAKVLLDAERAGAGNSKVRFIDMRAHSRGDNWSYLNRVIAALPTPRPGAPMHLFVIDGIDGLEVASGDLDAYGIQRDRRSRLAQLIRTAMGRCHLLLTVADRGSSHNSAEEYLSDLVVRLRYERMHDYERRVLAVEKARGLGHIRGEHQFTIRSGRPSTTGLQANPDDPAVPHPADGTGRTQAYFAVAPSLHWRARELMLAAEEGDPPGLRPAPAVGFGIPYLDSMLGSRPTGLEAGDEAGFSSADPVALIGEDGTFKSNLSKAFLAQGIRLMRVEEGKGCALLLITTKTIDQEGLAQRLAAHLGEPSLSEDEKRRLLVRRLEIHYIGSAMFLHILEQCVRAAQRVALGVSELPDDESKRRAEGYRVRLVIDNWTLIQQMFPELRQDDRLLPSVLLFLRREGIASVVVANESMGFSRDLQFKHALALRDLTSLHILTWRVPLHGQSRIAITASPPRDPERRMVIREMRIRGTRSAGGSDEAERVFVPEVVPEFELYQGLEAGEPTFVPLRILVHVAEAPGRKKNRLTRLERYWPCFERLASRLLGRNAFEIEYHASRQEYDALKDLSRLKGFMRDAESAVLMLDEFWAKPDGERTLRRVRDYLECDVRMPGGAAGQGSTQPNLIQDPFRLFQPTRADLAERLVKAEEWRRMDCFHTVGYDLSDYVAAHSKSLVKIPFYWDFGFLMLDATAWLKACRQGKGAKPRAESADEKKRRKEHNRQLRDAQRVWDALRSNQHVSWLDFTLAASFVAHSGGSDDDSMRATLEIPSDAGETLSCLLLEIWASQCGLDSNFRTSRENPAKFDLSDLVTTWDGHLYEALLILRKLLGNADFDRERRELHDERIGHAVAARCWFSTARKLQRGVATETQGEPGEAGDDADLQQKDGTQQEDKRAFVAVTLPGHFSVRGDWFLGVLRGSRSQQIADRAIDLLSSRRGNIARLQQGIGLPVRDCRDAAASELWTPLARLEPRPEESGEPRLSSDQVSYRDLREMGARGIPSDGGLGREDLAWLWRSRIKGYDGHARIWRRWIVTALMALVVPSPEELRRLGTVSSHSEPQWQKFQVLRDGLLRTLERGTSVNKMDADRNLADE
ncbi:MAG: hypothetical protein IT457_10650 [Planctomycetes bacterium]|nr:hypothetical protein [Planctomycetota bacterium]